MTNRQEVLVTAIKKRLIDTSGHVDTLRVACGKFGADFEEDAFIDAWNGKDQEQRLAAYAVQAGYENAINGAIRIAQELAEVAGWTTRNLEPSSTEVLKALHQNGVITTKTHAGLKSAYEDRNGLQHDYANTAARDIHRATTETLHSVPLLLQDAHQYVIRHFS